MPMRGPADPLPPSARRILIAGPSGVGKTTLAAVVADGLGVPRVEIDALYHGPQWTPRPEFAADVECFTAGPSWVMEWGYRSVKPMLVRRAELLVWLDHPRWTVLRRVVARTVARRLRRQVLWNGNVEPSLWSVLTDREHIIRWSWRVYGEYATVIPALLTGEGGERLTIVRLCGQRQVDTWLAGPFADAVRAARPSREVRPSLLPSEE